jgi:hypothetical protein
MPLLLQCVAIERAKQEELRKQEAQQYVLHAHLKGTDR